MFYLCVLMAISHLVANDSHGDQLESLNDNVTDQYLNSHAFVTDE